MSFTKMWKVCMAGFLGAAVALGAATGAGALVSHGAEPEVKTKRVSRGAEAGIARNTDFGDIPEISIGAETSSLKAEVTDGNVIMKLVPEKTGKYSFRADSGEDTIGWLCDEEGNELISNDDTDEGDDFVFSYLMEEGKTYYLQTRYYDDLQTGSFSVRVDYSLFYVQYEAEVTGGPGEEVVLTVYANTEEGAVLSYQWQDGEGSTIEGAEGAQYTIGELNRDFYAEYRCIVTDDRGNSETAFFEVRFDSGLRAEPVEETEIYVLPGESVTLQVEASTGENSGDLTYAWYCDGQEIEGADADRYTVEHANRAHSYDCKISDAYADSYVSFYVFIDTGLVWESELDYEVTLSPGETKTLSVAARNREECGALRYQWRYDDELIEGAQSSELTAAKTGWYSCEVQDDFSSLVTETFVRVDNGLSVSGIESYLTKTVNSGEPFTLSVIASAKTGDLSYQWEYFEDEIEDWKQAGNQAVLSVSGLTQDRTYRCTVSDIYNNRIERVYTVYQGKVTPGQDLKTGTEASGIIKEKGEMIVYKFVPDVTGMYSFYSKGEVDTIAELYDSYGSLLVSNDDGENVENTNFRVNSLLAAGMTYYLEVRLYSYGEDTATGSFQVVTEYSGNTVTCGSHWAYTGWITEQAASCKAAGKQIRKCVLCGAVIETRTVPATGLHSFGAWTTEKEADALKEGVQVRTCSVCGTQERRTVPKKKAAVKLNVSSLPLKVKQSTSAVKVTEMTAGDGVASWKSSNPKVAAVNSKGKITGKKTGTAVITVTMKSGASASVKIKVQKKAVKTTKVSVDKKKLTLKKGKSQTVKVTLTPLTSLEKVKFTSSNKKVAEVSAKGKIKGKKPGKAKITVKAGKKKAVIAVTVR